jgi:hypothetical protein
MRFAVSNPGPGLPNPTGPHDGHELSWFRSPEDVVQDLVVLATFPNGKH